MPISSSEFINLCQSQVTLLTQVLGASLSIVYLTGELVEGGTSQAKLIPIVAYPETAMLLQGSKVALLSENAGSRHTLPQLPRVAQSEAVVALDWPPSATNSPSNEEQVEETDELVPSTQIVLPLIHEEVVMGLLVTGRQDRPWNEEERTEIERIAQTLALACLLDRRREWLEQQLSQQQRLRAKQRDLLDNLLHQFRNPLTALRTFGKLLLKRLTSGDANREVAASIVRESDRLQELLQQFDRVIDLTAEDLDLRKSLPPAPLFMEAAVRPSPKPVMLLPDDSGSAELCWVADILGPLLSSAKAIAQERNLDIRADIPPNLPSVSANAKALREVLSNLIDNALKYTPSGGQIDIQGGLERGTFQGIAISDTGPGIPPEDLKHLFERHYRGVQAESEIAGTGLGLAIAKELVEQMQGEIQVFSPARHPIATAMGGPGVTFIVWLPTR
jgi:signal transduction histidine kinase